MLVQISQSDAACFLPVLFAQCNLLLSVWCGTLYDARLASVMWLQTADTESPEESFYFFSRLTGPPMMLHGGLLSNHRSTKLPRKVANPCTYPTSCRFPPLPKGQVFCIITFVPRISPGTLTQGKKKARPYETYSPAVVTMMMKTVATQT